MLTEEEKREITAELAHCEHKSAASIEALKVIQKRRGWVSDASIRDIAFLLDMTPAELDAVATFFNFIYRKPVGRHVIAVCDSIVCWSLGYDQLRELLQKSLGIGLGETTQDDRFTLLPASCLGACDRAPAMLVDEDLHGPVTPEMIDGILEKYR
ncbi:MAG: NADH-quinone oxidoreductase subunit NuoE [Nitrospirota bacterium]